MRTAYATRRADARAINQSLDEIEVGTTVAFDDVIAAAARRASALHPRGNRAAGGRDDSGLTLQKAMSLHEHAQRCHRFAIADTMPRDGWRACVEPDRRTS
jgi:hypothetical protein